MRLIIRCAALFFLSTLGASEQWPYNRFHGVESAKGTLVPQKSKPEFIVDPHNKFARWFRNIVDKDHTGQLREIFEAGSIPPNASLQDILQGIKTPEPPRGNASVPVPQTPAHQQAASLFSHLPFPLDTRCTADKFKW